MALSYTFSCRSNQKSTLSDAGPSCNSLLLPRFQIMSSPDDETSDYAEASRIILLSVGVPMFIAGIINNILNLLTFVFIPQFNKPSNSIFLLASFLGSQVNLITAFLPQLIHRISESDPLSHSVILCKLRWFLGPLSRTFALHCICFAAINQYLLTSRSVRLRQLMTRRRAALTSLIVLGYETGLSIPSTLFYTHFTSSANITTCTSKDPTFAVYTAHLAIVTYSLIPIIVLSICSILTWRNLRSNLVRQRDLEQSLARMLLAQIVMILLTSIANVINQMYFFYTRTVPKTSLRLAQESVASSIFTLFGFSAHSISFYVYALASKAFRQNIRSFIDLKRRRVHPGIPR